MDVWRAICTGVVPSLHERTSLQSGVTPRWTDTLTAGTPSAQTQCFSVTFGTSLLHLLSSPSRTGRLVDEISNVGDIMVSRRGEVNAAFRPGQVGHTR